ncbi:MAG: glycosyltransferase family 2 protein [Phycisphaerae bacterium]|nr:glycosyltransferase family 2 protein [Gemmatimonadaceae bacterium]
MTAKSAQAIELSVVVPAFNESGNINALIERLCVALSAIEASFEIIIVDDGSRDATWTELRNAALQRENVIGLSLSRNFGHQSALLAGLSRAQGQAIVSMDADLQHAPEVLLLMWAAWKDGAQVVRTIRRDDGVASSSCVEA